MKGSASAILLMLSLVAILLVGAAAVADDAIIRLPVGQSEDAVTEETRPWDCCDHPVCTRASWCACKDLVEQCAETCKNCKLMKQGDELHPSEYMCRDAYHGKPGPNCTNPAVIAAGN